MYQNKNKNQLEKQLLTLKNKMTTRCRNKQGSKVLAKIKAPKK
jgi:hypothetical protein